jgi:hypothetical protein
VEIVTPSTAMNTIPHKTNHFKKMKSSLKLFYARVNHSTIVIIEKKWFHIRMSTLWYKFRNVTVQKWKSWFETL